MSQSATFVSILIPTYKRAAYLRDAIKSALAQTYSAIEILVLDDASPDNTPEVVAEFKSDLRVKYIRHEQNLGITGNWRFGISSAQGDFFCILHDDDTFEPSFIQQALQPLQNDRELILAFTDHWIMSAEGQRLPQASNDGCCHFKRNTLPSGKLEHFARSALIDMSIPIGATMFRKCLVKPEFIAEEAKGAIDIWLLYQCIKTGYQAHYISERLMNYRAHAQGMSHSRDMRPTGLEGQLFRQRHIIQDHQLEVIHSAVYNQISSTLVNLGAAQLRQGQVKKARTLVRESLSHGVTLRNIAVYVLACSGRLGVHVAEAIDIR